jgi:hypothetical protein
MWGRSWFIGQFFIGISGQSVIYCSAYLGKKIFNRICICTIDFLSAENKQNYFPAFQQGFLAM